MIGFLKVEANGLSHRVAVSGPEDGQLVLFVHGFPESWYSWRHQLEALGAAGYRCAAPDVRGYGETDKPDAVEAYDFASITADMAGIAKALSPHRPAVVVGHDWGAPLAWHSALLHPQQFKAVAGLSVPYLAPGQFPAIDVFLQFFTARGLFFYQVYFQEEGVAEAELEADPAATIRKFYYAISGDSPDGTWPSDKRHGDALLDRLPEPPMPLPWLNDVDVAYYASQFAASGFRGPLNRYRNHRRDHALLTSLDDNRIHQPSLFIGGTEDLVLKMFPGDPVEAMKPHLPNLQGVHLLDGCGHWTQQERADDVNKILLEWLGGL
jgi:pimeloyl-ACP methyl ester carboxylesterase